MFKTLIFVLRPSKLQAAERYQKIQQKLDDVARETMSRFSRGNAAIQMGYIEFEEELDAKRDALIARHAVA